MCRYVALDQEMREVCLIWRAAKDQISTYQEDQRKKLERKKAHFERIIADGESFKQLKRQQQCASGGDGGDKENAQPGSVEGVAQPGSVEGDIYRIRPVLVRGYNLYRERPVSKLTVALSNYLLKDIVVWVSGLC